MSVDLVVPDLGSFAEVSVVEVLVKPGDVIDVDAPLVTLETDKASMDVPAPQAGTVAEVLLKSGDKVSKGSLIARLAGDSAAAGQAATAGPSPDAQSLKAAPAAADTLSVPASVQAPAAGGSVPADDNSYDRATQVVVLGAGPGGYTTAFRAADLGLQVTLIERWDDLGGVCLNVGCIPSKALLHAAKVLEEAKEMGEHGVAFGQPAIDLERLRGWKSSVVKKLTGGLKVLARQRKVDVVHGTGRFVSPHIIEVEGKAGTQRIRFDQCIIAAGSEPAQLPFLPQDPRIMDSTDALELPEFGGSLLVIGGGIIGLEMACVYEALGGRVTVVELTGQLIPDCDPDLVRPLQKRITPRYEKILLNTKVVKVEALGEGLQVTFEGANAPPPTVYDRVLVAVGRVPNGRQIGADAAGVQVTDRGFIPVDSQMRTNVPHIFAIGDIVGNPMLAHKAMHEGKVAAEVAAGHARAFQARVIPAVAYTDPEIAWTGLSETEAKERGIAYEKGSFPWVASGRSLSLGREEGFTKILFDPDTHRVLGGGIVGTNAGELITEISLAVEGGLDAQDIGLTIHPHPTLSETVAGAAEAFDGTLTDLYIPRRK
jgi:dihydrolipoamide dehydrogenase